MRIVVALGGNALLRRGQPMTAENQRENVRVAARALAPVAAGNELVISHGNGPQVGLLALQGAAYPDVEAYPLDVLGAQTEGMIGYLIEQELGNLLPVRAAVRDHPHDGRGRPRRPGVRRPDQVHRSGLCRRRRPSGSWRRRAGRSGRTATSWRRVVPSPDAPAHLRDPADPLAAGARRRASSARAAAASRRCSCRAPTPSVGAEVVIDKDRRQRAAGPRARRRPVRDGHRRRRGLRRLGHARAAAARPGHAGRAARPARSPAGSMGPKVEAAVDFVRRTGKRAATRHAGRRGRAGGRDARHQRRGWLTGRDGREMAASQGPATEGLESGSAPTHVRGVLAGRWHPHRAHLHHGLAVRHRCHGWSAPGRALPERGRRGPVGAPPGTHDGSHQRGSDRRRIVRDGCHLHPARGGCPHRHLEHGRHDPDRRVLRHRPPPATGVLPQHGAHLRARGAGHRQFLDDRGDTRGCARGPGALAGGVAGNHGGGRHLRCLLR